MQAFSHQSSAGRLRCDCSQFTAYTLFNLNHIQVRNKLLHSVTAQASNAHLEPTAASAAPQGSVDENSKVAITLDNTFETQNSRRRARYLTYAEYIELKAQQQPAANGLGHPTHADSKQPKSTTQSQESTKKRVPWNKGRKHSALTIARITQAATLAAQRPEVRAKYEAWNQTRIGVPLPEQHRENIKKASEARLHKWQNASPEELEALRAAVSERSKALWQDPEYADKTTAAIRAAARRRALAEREAAERQEPGSSSRVGSSPASKSKQRRVRAAGAEEQGEDQQQQQDQQPVRQPRQRQPTKKELAAAAAEQHQQLQQQVLRLLQTQQLIHTTERTVQQLQANLAAFENNPQSYAMASQTMQRAQAHLQQARAQVQQLEQNLGEYGVQWDADTGQITHISNGLAAELQQRKAAAKGARKARNSTAGGSGSGEVGSNEDGVVRSRRGRPSGPGTSNSSSSSLVGSTLPGDVVPSSRRAAAAGSVLARSNGKASSSKSSAAAAEEAAAGGGSRGSSHGNGSWSMVGSQVNGGSSSVKLNGHHQQLVNGHNNGYKGVEGSGYVTVQLQAVEGGEV